MVHGKENYVERPSGTKYNHFNATRWPGTYIILADIIYLGLLPLATNRKRKRKELKKNKTVISHFLNATRDTKY